MLLGQATGEGHLIPGASMRRHLLINKRLQVGAAQTAAALAIAAPLECVEGPKGGARLPREA